MPLVFVLALPFAGSIIAALLPSNARKLEAWLAGAIALICLAIVFAQLPQMFNGHVVKTVLPWMPG